MNEKEVAEVQVIRFPKPKILLIDCPAEAAELLAKDGYNAASGTFGRPYRVEPGEGFLPVIGRPRLPNYTEQEVVVIDLASPETADAPESEKAVSHAAKDWWATTKFGLIDPRPRAMAFVQDTFDRLFRTGGILVVFCEPRHKQEMVFASGDRFGHLEPYPQEIDYDNWSFLSSLSGHSIGIHGEHGVEISVVGDKSAISMYLRRHAAEAQFSATLHPQWELSEDSEGPVFYPLMNNKFGAAVGGVILDPETKALVILLPHFKDKAKAIHDLIAHVLPDIVPHHFPFNEGTKWLADPTYEHPHIISLGRKQDEIRTHADNEIEKLDVEIVEERERLAFLHGILTKTGDGLVQDVKKALQTMGFVEVIDVDEEAEAGSANKQEDLQIHDARPVLLAEVKGLSGVPTEGDTLQVVKYIPRRMKEWSHTDVSGLVIINHQRSIPPLDRRHDAVFTQQQAEDAENHDIVLVTTWELFRLLRGMTAFKWHPDVVRGLFYGKGRISPIPLHWKLVGHVAHFYDKAGVASIELIESIKVGDKIGFLLASEYVEEDVTSLQVEQEQVEQAMLGQRVGHKTARTREEMKEGLPVYVVKQEGIQ